MVPASFRRASAVAAAAAAGMAGGPASRSPAHPSVLASAARVIVWRGPPDVGRHWPASRPRVVAELPPSSSFRLPRGRFRRTYFASVALAAAMAPLTDAAPSCGPAATRGTNERQDARGSSPSAFGAVVCHFAAAAAGTATNRRSPSCQRRPRRRLARIGPRTLAITSQFRPLPPGLRSHRVFALRLASANLGLRHHVLGCPRFRGCPGSESWVLMNRSSGNGVAHFRGGPLRSLPLLQLQRDVMFMVFGY